MELVFLGVGRCAFGLSALWGFPVIASGVSRVAKRSFVSIHAHRQRVAAPHIVARVLGLFKTLRLVLFTPTSKARE